MNNEITREGIENLEEQHPLISFCLTTYNHEKYIKEAIEGAFAQTYSPLEIILSDDCSTDRTFDIMSEMVSAYTGPHKIILNRNEKNMGWIPHYNKIMNQFVHGVYMVAASGDDISLSDRTEIMYNVFVAHPDLIAVDTDVQQIDASGALGRKTNVTSSNKVVLWNLDDYIDNNKLPYNDHVPCNGAARMMRCDLYSFFGPLKDWCPEEDSTTRLRILMLGNFGYLPQRTIKYRVHENNMSGPKNYASLSLSKKYKQMLYDMNLALKKGFITRNSYNALKKRLRVYARYKWLTLIIPYRKSFFYTIPVVLLSGELPLRTKLSIIKIIIFSFFKR